MNIVKMATKCSLEYKLGDGWGELIEYWMAINKISQFYRPLINTEANNILKTST